MRTLILQLLLIAIVTGVMLGLRYLVIDRPSLKQKPDRIYFLPSDKASAQAIQAFVGRQNTATRWTWLLLLLFLPAGIGWFAPASSPPFYPYGRFTVAAWHEPPKPIAAPLPDKSPHPVAYGRFGTVKPLSKGHKS